MRFPFAITGVGFGRCDWTIAMEPTSAGKQGKAKSQVVLKQEWQPDQNARARGRSLTQCGEPANTSRVVSLTSTKKNKQRLAAQPPSHTSFGHERDEAADWPHPRGRSGQNRSPSVMAPLVKNTQHWSR